MSFFSFGRDTEAGTGTPATIEWTRGPSGRFYNLISFASFVEGLRGVSGVFVIWHGGVKPTWVYVGRTHDLAGSLKQLAQDEDILYYHRFGGLFVTWATFKEEFQAGVLKYLVETMHPLVENPDQPGPEVVPVPVTVPRSKEKV